MNTNRFNQYIPAIAALKAGGSVFIISSIMNMMAYFLTSNIIQHPQEMSTLAYQLLIVVIAVTIITFTTTYYLLRWQQQRTEQAQAESTTITHPHLLIVDDNPANLLILKGLLNDQPVITTLVNNGKQAIEYMQSTGADAIFMDIEMDGINGIEATQSIRAYEKHHRQKRCPIVAVSAHSESEKRQQAKTNKQALTNYQHTSRTQINTASIANTHTHKLAASAKTGTIDKVIDIDMSLHYSNNSPQLAKDMLILLIDMIRKESALFKQYYHEKEWDQLSQLSHKLHGGSCYCGVPKLQSSCKIVDTLLQQKHYDNIHTPMETLLSAMEEIVTWDDEYDIDIIFE